MRYKGKACEIVGEKEVFGQHIAWIRLMEDGSFHEVPYEELEKPSTEFSMPYLRFVSIAAKIKDEVARKSILAPYESSLIPLPHQILVLEKVMQSNQNRFMLADVFAYAFLLAHQCGLDVEEIVKAKVAKNGLKYPVDKSKGSAKKYTEL